MEDNTLVPSRAVSVNQVNKYLTYFRPYFHKLISRYIIKSTVENKYPGIRMPDFLCIDHFAFGKLKAQYFRKQRLDSKPDCRRVTLANLDVADLLLETAIF